VKKQGGVGTIVELLPRQLAGRHNRGTMEVVTCTDTVVKMKHEHHQQQPEKARTIIVVNKHDGDKYGDKWLGGAGSKSYRDIPAPPYVKGIFFIRIMEGGMAKSWLKKS
jgi:hypothetical protein